MRGVWFILLPPDNSPIPSWSFLLFPLGNDCGKPGVVRERWCEVEKDEDKEEGLRDTVRNGREGEIRSCDTNLL